MPIYKGTAKKQIFKGDYHPARWCKGGTKIAGYNEQNFSGIEIIAENTYNDTRFPLMINGKTVQSGTPDIMAPADLACVSGMSILSESTGGTKSQAFPVPYTLHGLFDMCDQIYRIYESGQWRVKYQQSCGEMICDGSADENWSGVYQAMPDKITYYLRDDVIKSGQNIALSDRFTNQYKCWDTNTVGLFSTHTAYGAFFINVPASLSSRPVLLNWLASNPVKFVYLLKDPVVSDITDTETGQALLKFPACYPYTRIYTAGSAIKPSISAGIKIQE